MTGLYLHIPFCRRKCPYCDFYSVVSTAEWLAEYPDLLQQQLARAVARDWQGPIATVYFGGGTPSLLPPARIGELLEAVDRQLGLASGAEISLEANPGTLSLSGLQALRATGVNRLSLGLQTLDERQLVRLGRLHDRQAGLQAVNQARAAGFDNLALDLMFALPDQTPADLARELDQYLDLGAEHLSCYGLTSESGTPFAVQVESGTLQLPDSDQYAEAYLQIHERLTAAGYEHYEIANYARPGHRCEHNLGYWQRRNCLGLGAGAHSFAASNWGSRWAVPADLAAYRQALAEGTDPAVCLERFDRQGALRETVYLGLRIREGLADDILRQTFGVGLAEAFPDAVAGIAPWLARQPSGWTLTPAGWLLYDRLIQAFL